MKVVLLAAGFGSRLWPLSTSGRPKQFQILLGQQSLIQYTYELFANIAPPEDTYILTLQGLEHWVYEQLPDIKPERVLLVPERRNTLPHTLFALRSIAENEDEPILFTGTDMYFSDTEEFIKTVKSAIRKSEGQKSHKDIILTCSSAEGIDPNAGYMTLRGDHVTTFIEKPDSNTLAALSKDERTYKNIFTFIASISSLKQSFRSMSPHLVSSAKKLATVKTPDISEAFLNMPFSDINHEVFATTHNLIATVTKSNFLDMGNFTALHEINKKDKNGNVIFGQVILDGGCANNYIANHTDQPLVVIDANDMAIVHTPWGNLTAPLTETKRVGEIYKKNIHPNGPRTQP